MSSRQIPTAGLRCHFLPSALSHLFLSFGFNPSKYNSLVFGRLLRMEVLLAVRLMLTLLSRLAVNQ